MPQQADPKVKKLVTLTERTIQALDEIAHAEETSRSNLIREACRYLIQQRQARAEKAA